MSSIESTIKPNPFLRMRVDWKAGRGNFESLAQILGHFFATGVPLTLTDGGKLPSDLAAALRLNANPSGLILPNGTLGEDALYPKPWTTDSVSKDLLAPLAPAVAVHLLAGIYQVPEIMTGSGRLLAGYHYNPETNLPTDPTEKAAMKTKTMVDAMRQFRSLFKAFGQQGISMAGQANAILGLITGNTNLNGIARAEAVKRMELKRKILWGCPVVIGAIIGLPTHSIEAGLIAGTLSEIAVIKPILDSLFGDPRQDIFAAYQEIQYRLGLLRDGLKPIFSILFDLAERQVLLSHKDTGMTLTDSGQLTRLLQAVGSKLQIPENLLTDQTSRVPDKLAKLLLPDNTIPPLAQTLIGTALIEYFRDQLRPAELQTPLPSTDNVGQFLNQAGRDRYRAVQTIRRADPLIALRIALPVLGNPLMRPDTALGAGGKMLPTAGGVYDGRKFEAMVETRNGNTGNNIAFAVGDRFWQNFSQMLTPAAFNQVLTAIRENVAQNQMSGTDSFFKQIIANPAFCQALASIGYWIYDAVDTSHPASAKLVVDTARFSLLSDLNNRTNFHASLILPSALESTAQITAVFKQLYPDAIDGQTRRSIFDIARDNISLAHKDILNHLFNHFLTGPNRDFLFDEKAESNQDLAYFLTWATRECPSELLAENFKRLGEGLERSKSFGSADREALRPFLAIYYLLRYAFPANSQQENLNPYGIDPEKQELMKPLSDLIYKMAEQIITINLGNIRSVTSDDKGSQYYIDAKTFIFYTSLVLPADNLQKLTETLSDTISNALTTARTDTATWASIVNQSTNPNAQVVRARLFSLRDIASGIIQTYEEKKTGYDTKKLVTLVEKLNSTLGQDRLFANPQPVRVT